MASGPINEEARRENSNQVPMQGKGLYNSNSALQWSAMKDGLKLLDSLKSHDHTKQVDGNLGIAEYGCAQGINSIVPFKMIIDQSLISGTSSHIGQNFQLFFTDRPENDFNSLSRLISGVQWVDLEKNAFIWPMMIGGNFFRRLLPPGSIDVGFSFAALHHLSHFIPNSATSNREEWQRCVRDQARQDLEDFLESRAQEFKPNGELVVSFVSAPPERASIDPALMTAFRLAMGNMREEKLIPEQLEREFQVATYQRSLREVQSSLKQFEGVWKLQSISEKEILHPAFEELQGRLNNVSDEARRQYAHTVITWGMAVLSGYFSRALHRSVGEPINPDDEESLKSEWAERAKAIFLHQEQCPKVSSWFIFMKLTRC